MGGDLLVEIWVAARGLPDYEVSSEGRVRRATRGKGTYVGRVLKTPIDDGGYPTVNLAGMPRRVHVLVADAFLGPLRRHNEVHHINERRDDPRLENLEVKPSSLAHAELHRRRQSGRRRHGQRNTMIACACACGQRFRKFDSGGRPRRYVSGHNLHPLAAERG